ncbi:hypothetical protein M2266_006386 [Streptomyces sp. SPB162]|nr:hypothetical protein [Streptomyces sp. SPB162]
MPRAPNDGTDRVRRRRQDHDDYWDTDPPEPQGREEKW